jgi:lactate racemase
MLAEAEPYDVVITTNSGYPLDQNLYQCVKGMSAAARLVRDGGAIIMAAACADGLPDHGRYAALLHTAGSPERVLATLEQPGFCEPDQWQVQIQAQIQRRAEVHVFSGGLSDEQIRRALFIPCRDLEQTVAHLLERYGAKARLAVLPEGPQVIATVGNGKL